MNAIWGAGLLSLSKLIVVVDADCDVHDYAEVAWRAFGNVDYAHDVLHTVGPVDHLDHASYEQFFGGKLGVDATRKLASEGYHRDGGWPAECVLDPATRATVDRRWAEYGIGSGRR
ncbi:MAG: menaquinone biosynthesis decarboxylase, partial [Jatrophihabitantaceae bacterium]